MYSNLESTGTTESIQYPSGQSRFLETKFHIDFLLHSLFSYDPFLLLCNLKTQASPQGDFNSMESK